MGSASITLADSSVNARMDTVADSVKVVGSHSKHNNLYMYVYVYPVWNVSIIFISTDLRRSTLFGVTCLGSFQFFTFARQHVLRVFIMITRYNVIRCNLN